MFLAPQPMNAKLQEYVRMERKIKKIGNELIMQIEDPEDMEEEIEDIMMLMSNAFDYAEHFWQAGQKDAAILHLKRVETVLKNLKFDLALQENRMN